MKFSIESWSPEYGSAVEDDLQGAERPPVDLTCERTPARWEPLSPSSDARPPDTILFTDGVRRVDARLWIDDGNGGARAGVCASYAAGAVLCDGRARVVAAEVQRGLFTPAAGAEVIVCRHAAYPVRAAAEDSPEKLWLAVQDRMGQLEIDLATALPAELVIVDGPLRGRRNVAMAVGYVKTHYVPYLSDEVSHVIGELQAGQRTPLFLTQTSWSRYSWYMRLPGAEGHAWAGVVRCEAAADMPVEDAVALADRVAATLPRFSSHAHKDPRAPQNLYPIAGLERELRHRLGDPALLYRGLRLAAAAA